LENNSLRKIGAEDQAMCTELIALAGLLYFRWTNLTVKKTTHATSSIFKIFKYM